MVSSPFRRLDFMIFISFIYLFIYPAGFVALIPWAGGYFHLMNALYFSFVREVAKLFWSKLFHWRWWFSWGEQTQTTLWLFIILAASRGSKPKANDTTRRKNSLCHIYGLEFWWAFFRCLEMPSLLKTLKHAGRCQKENSWLWEPSDLLSATLNPGMSPNLFISHSNLVHHNHRRW